MKKYNSFNHAVIFGLGASLVIAIPLITVGAFAQRQTQDTPSVQPATPPLPEDVSSPIASVIPKRGNVNVELTNTTNTVVTYEIIGHTNQRQLQGGEKINLKDIPLPVTITLIRPDNGFLKVIPVSSKSDLLRITLQENSQFNETQGAIRIQKNGQVYLN